MLMFFFSRYHLATLAVSHRLALSIKHEQNFVGVYEVGKKFWRGKKDGNLLVSGRLSIDTDHVGAVFVGFHFFHGSAAIYVKFSR